METRFSDCGGDSRGTLVPEWGVYGGGIYNRRQIMGRKDERIKTIHRNSRIERRASMNAGT